MTEYIIEWSGIGARIVELIGSVPTYLIPKRLREERLREPIVRCRDCASFREEDWKCKSFQWRNCYESPDVEPDGFCAWSERRDADNASD